MDILGSEAQILNFPNNYSKRVLKNYTKDLETRFPHSVRTSNNRYWRLFPCPLYALCQMECSLQKVLQKCSLKWGYYIHYGIVETAKNWEKINKSSWRRNTQTLHVENNYFKLTLKNYIEVLQNVFTYSLLNIPEKFKNTTEKSQKSCFSRSSDFVIWHFLKKHWHIYVYVYKYMYICVYYSQKEKTF